MHPDTRVEIWWISNAGFKFTVETTYENLKDCLIELFESSLIDNVEYIFYTIENETTSLDYYNAEF